jgi:vacuolar protein sorting-associated protein 13A/C
MKMQIALSGSFTLADTSIVTPHSPNADSKKEAPTFRTRPIVTITFTELFMDMEFKQGSFKSLVTMSDIGILDQSNPDSYYTKILARRKTETSHSKFLQIAFEKIPRDGDNDFFIAVHIDRVDIVINLKLLQRITSFLLFDHVNLQHLEMQARKNFEKIKRFVKREIKAALESAFPLNLDLVISAPNILIPLDPDIRDTRFLLFDLGHLKLQSNHSDRGNYNRKLLEGIQVNPMGLFDRYNFSMDDIQIIVPNLPAHQFFETYPNMTDSSLHMMEKVSLDLSICKSIALEQCEDRILVTGNIPNVTFHVSPEKMRVAMNLIDEFNGLIDNPSGYGVSDVRLSGYLIVDLSPITEESIWRSCWIEVRSTRKMIIYETLEVPESPKNGLMINIPKKSTAEGEPDNMQQIAILKLDPSIEIGEDLENLFQIIIPQDVQPINFNFKCGNKQARDRWVLALRSLIESYRTNFFVGDVADTMIEDVKKEAMLEDDIPSKIKPPRKEQGIAKAVFQLNECKIHLTNEKSIATIGFSKLRTQFRHRLHDTSLNISLHTMGVRDLTKGDDVERYMIQSNAETNEEHLAEVSVIRAKEESPLYNPNAQITLAMKCQNVQLFSEPYCIMQFIQFGYDLQDISDKFNAHGPQFASNVVKKTSVELEPLAIRLDARLGEIKLFLNNDGEKLASMSMSSSNFEIDLLWFEKLQICGTLGNLIVTDHSISGSLYPEILGLGSKEEGSLITFAYHHKFGKDAVIIKGEEYDYKQSFSAQLKAIRYVHIQRFVQHLQGYVRGPLQHALMREEKRLVKDYTYIQAPEQVTHQQVKLSIEMTSPIIVVPASYKSSDQFIANLGNLHISNSLTMVDNVLIDGKLVTLNNMFLTSVYRGESSRSVADVNVVISIETANQAERYGIPQTKVGIDISDVSIIMTQQQYQLVFIMVHANILDGLTSIHDEREFYSSINSISKRRKMNRPLQISSPALSPATQLQVIVRVPEMNVSLLRREKEEIAKLDVKQLHVSHVVRLDEAETVVTLDQMVAKDTRTSTQNKFPIIFDSRSSTSDDSKCFYFYLMERPRDKSIKLELSDPKFVFVPDIFIEFKNFFTNIKYVSELEKDQSQLSNIARVFTPSTPMDEPRVEFSGKFGKPTIELPQDYTNESSKLLVLEGAFQVKYVGTDNHEIGELEIYGVTAYISRLNESTSIVDPITITGHLESFLDEGEKKRKIAIGIGKGGQSRVSYQDMKLIFQIIRGFQFETENVESEPVNAVSNDEAPILDDEQTVPIQDEHAAVVDTTSTSVMDILQKDLKYTLENHRSNIQVSFKTEKQVISILIVDDIRGYDIPLLEFHVSNIDVEGNILQNEDRVVVHLPIRFQMFTKYYNFKIAEWEPIIEENKHPYEIIYVRGPNEQNPAIDTDKIQFRAIDPININVTHAMIDTVVSTSKYWISAIDNSEVPAIPLRFEPFAIRNETGLSVSFWKEDNQVFELNSREEVRFGFTDFRSKDFKNSKHYIHVSVEKNTPKKILVNKDCRYHFIIQYQLRTDNQMRQYQSVICVSIKLVEGKKIITLHSGIELVNSTNQTFELGVYLPKKTAPSSLGDLLPNTSTFVPAPYINEGSLAVRPHTYNELSFQWSEITNDYSFKSFCKDVNKKMLVHCRQTATERKGRERFYVILDLNRNIKLKNANAIDVTVTLRPPLSIQNLLSAPITYTLFTKMQQPGEDNDSRMTGKWSSTLQKGEKHLLYTINMKKSIWMKSNMPGWQTSDFNLIYSIDRHSEWDYSFHITDKKKQQLKCRLDYSANGNAYHEVMVYCSYWILNRTNIDNLSIRTDSSDVDVAGKFQDEILMFDYNNTNIVFSNKMRIAIDNETSETFNIDNVKNSGEIVIGSRILGLYVDIGSDEYKRTKIVTITPRYVVVNHTGKSLSVRPYKSNAQIDIDSDCTAPFHSSDMMCVTMQGFEWSSPFKTNLLTEIPLILRRKKEFKRKNIFVIVRIHQEGGTIFVMLERSKQPPYYIDNLTRYDYIISQKNTERYFVVKSMIRVPYSWPDQNAPHTLILKMDNRDNCLPLITTSIDIDIVSNRKLLRIKELKRLIHIKISAEGLTRVVTITEQEENIVEGGLRSEETEQDEEYSRPTILQISSEIRGIGISLIDDRPREILYAFIDNLVVQFSMSDIRQFLETKVTRLQVNNQLQDALFPVVFTNHKKLDTEFIHFSMVRAHQEEKFDFVPYFSLLIQECDMNMDLSLLSTLTNFALDFIPNTSIPQRTHTSMPISSKKVYFELLQLHPIKMNVTFIFNEMEKQVNTLDQETQNADTKRSNAAFLVLQTLGGSLSANIDDVPIRLNALILRHPFMSRVALWDSLTKHYSKYLFAEMYKIIGSFGFIGNPIGLFNDIDTGVHDLFYEPLNGITKSPHEFSRGLARGSISFLKHSIHGTFNTASKVTESIGNGLSYLTMDEDYQEKRRMSQRQKPKHAGEGLVSGIQLFAGSLLDGATGIVTKPIKGASRDGVSGFFRGVGQGIVGIPVKPVAAVLDMAHKTTEGIRNTTTYFEREERVRTRKPRAFGADDTVTPYDEKQADGQDILFIIDDAKYLRESEKYLHHCDLVSIGVMILLSSGYLFLLDRNNLTIQWFHPLKEIQNSAMHRGDDTSNLKFILTREAASKYQGWFSGPVNERVVTVFDPNEIKECEIMCYRVRALVTKKLLPQRAI